MFKLRGLFFYKSDEESFYNELRKFSCVEEVEFTEPLKEILDKVIEVVLLKNRWADPERSRGIAEDLAQEVYVMASTRMMKNIYKRMVSVDNQITSLYSYLFRATQNVCWSYIRKSPRLDFIEDYSEVIDKSVGLVWVPSSDLYKQMEMAELENALDLVLDSIVISVESEKEYEFCKWLCHVFKSEFVLILEDCWPFMELPAERRVMLFHKLDVQLRRAFFRLQKAILIGGRVNE